MLTSKQRKALKALAHHKKPVVQLGKKGLTDEVVLEVERALLAHELIKVKVAEDDVDESGAALAARTGAELVTTTGKIAMLYRAHPDEPTIKLP